MSPDSPTTPRLFARLSRREAARVGRLLRTESIGGLIVVIAAALGFIAANSPLAPGYAALRDTHLGVPALGLDLSVGHWASDGLLAIFFFIVGLELKREFVAGELRRFSTAIVPVAAAVGGVVIPALLYFAVNAGGEGAGGWAIPTATDIAFAVAVLGVIAPGVPVALRLFLLTLAVVDDLIAILIIAVAFTDALHLLPLVIAIIPLSLFAFVARRFARPLARHRWLPWCTLLPLGIIVWALVHASGIHATIAGVALAFLVPVERRDGTTLAADLEHSIRPLSTGFAVPVFAFFAAGVALGGASRFPFDPIAIGIMLGLVVGKPLGIALTTWLVTRFTRAGLDPSVSWRELLGVASLAGVGFTVSLLVTELSLPDAGDADTARLAVMAGSLIAVALSATLLVRRRGATRAG